MHQHRVSVRLVIAFLVFGSSLAGTCEKDLGWVWTPFKTCYKVFASPKSTWDEAQATCVASGGALMTLENPAKIQFMKGRRANQPDLRFIPHMWFGGRKVNGTWYWVSPNQLTADVEIEKFDWAPGEPSGYGYKKNVGECLNIYGATRCFGRGNTQMDDDWCNQSHSFVCEKSQKLYKMDLIG